MPKSEQWLWFVMPSRAMIEHNDKQEKVNCFKCVHFVITWNNKFPRACRLFGFKSKDMPSVMVLNTTGSRCNAFVEKKQGN